MATDEPHWDVVEDDEDCGMLLNGSPVDSDRTGGGENREDDIRQWLMSMGLDYGVRQCPMCGHALRCAHKIEDDGDGVLQRELQVLSCDQCAYWFYWNCENVGASLYGCPYATKTTSRLPCLRRVSNKLPIGCSTELAQVLRRSPSLWPDIDPRQFELLVADVFRANYANAEVIHVGRPADGGVDIFLVDSGGDKWLIQAKRRENPQASEGVGTLRSLLGTLVLEGASRGMIVSTADHFSYQAVKARDRADKIGYKILLHDRGILNRMLDGLLPDRPWLRFVSEEQADWLEDVAAAIPSRRQGVFPW